jgi:hypothetical protein
MVAHRVLDLIFRGLDVLEGARHVLQRKPPPTQPTPTPTVDEEPPLAARTKPRVTKKVRAPATPKKKPRVSARKGSVDRSGKDLSSPRADAVFAWVQESQHTVLAADAAIDGKKIVARVAWALEAATRASVDGGLTAADVSALLSHAMSIEMFATNVARALREETELFVETVPDGRSKRYTLATAVKNKKKRLPRKEQA